ncbi:MAG: GGDEF domain-containing protein [Pelosinus sp.]|nr:GGDEF domain-containing protein [Pelosinus sp.]
MDMNSIVDDMKVFAKYYDKVRIVDPVKKQVMSTVDNNATGLEVISETQLCYDFWAEGSICLNCISMRAALENGTFVKFQATEDKVYMITAMPIHLSERIVVLELLKDVTSRNILGNVWHGLTEHTDFEEIRTSIAKLNAIAITDELTKVYNRRYISERLPLEIIRSSKQPCSLIMADIDHFKRVNDQYGHIIGDEVLKYFALELTKNIREQKEDWVARYGGEEFLICLNDCDAKAAKTIAERMRTAIEHLALPTAGGTIKITASFGVHTFSRETVVMTDLLASVDKNLYEAKNTGRNRVIAD